MGEIQTFWEIIGIDGQTLFIRVRSQSTAALAGARSRAEFTTFRSCTSTAIGCPNPLTAPRGAFANGVENDMKMRNEAGFSLIEMIVAIAVTLVVTGAVYGLIAGGNNAFRREPELTERQQNVRMAMDLIMRDVQTTGSGLPAFSSPSRRGLDACSASAHQPRGHDARLPGERRPDRTTSFAPRRRPARPCPTTSR